jgi:glucan phosphoethanolaminetransferase (alkaline phosphatase superfamily)
MKHFLESIINKLKIKHLYNYINEKREINYLYFIILLALVNVFSLSYFLFMEQPLFGAPLFFLFYALGQAFLEVSGFVLIAYVLNRWAPRWLFFLFIAFSFIVILVHFTDFTMLRLMDASISYIFKFLFAGSLSHLGTAFQALNMNIGMIATIILTILAIPFLGLLLYWGTALLIKKLPLQLSLLQIGLSVLILGNLLLGLEFAALPFLNRSSYNKYQKALPFGITFLPPTPQCIHLERPISSYRNEKETRKKIPRFKLKAKPNVYLFVIETLRRDFVNMEIAPNLTRFGASNISFSSSFANANWTPLSWFAIFHSDFPHHWTGVRDNWKGGSIPLSIFKKMGYKTRVYSSADLRYFDMDKVLFGKKRELGDRIEEFSFDRSIEPCDRDELCLHSFERDLLSPDGREGNLFIFFFDSTHSEYSFPKDAPPKFEPIVKKIDYLTLTPKEIEPVKNRYRNSIYFVDSLLGRFFHLLERESLYESAIIACTGDHGEEFYEEGALFHGTHLNRYQTEVPLFFKLPGKTALTSLATHVDIFPTLLHTLTGHSDFSALFDGQSVLKERLWPYRIAILQNGPDTPCEFAIENEKAKLQARFLTPRDIYHQTELEIVELRLPTADEPISLEDKLEKYFPNALEPLQN